MPHLQTLTMLTTTLQGSPRSLRQLLKIPITSYAQPLQFKCHNHYKLFQPHHHNRLNRLQRFYNLPVDATALPPPLYNRRNYHQLTGCSRQLLGMPGNGENSWCLRDGTLWLVAQSTSVCWDSFGDDGLALALR